ncbi:hypothetical protein CDCA_CDCA02G0482 [Cyanidium caldarium]|uniref:Uncharacterized protein n=1 Tax=Cyanidium caldarium TaxID=2771 RepID=A0AAV9IQE8_CYACA|nr:hypothetical protein CDCA_CDCA02G0482 [Cyanidium caldarium]
MAGTMSTELGDERSVTGQDAVIYLHRNEKLYGVIVAPRVLVTVPHSQRRALLRSDREGYRLRERPAWTRVEDEWFERDWYPEWRRLPEKGRPRLHLRADEVITDTEAIESRLSCADVDAMRHEIRRRQPDPSAHPDAISNMLQDVVLLRGNSALQIGDVAVRAPEMLLDVHRGSIITLGQSVLRWGAYQPPFPWSAAAVPVPDAPPPAKSGGVLVAHYCVFQMERGLFTCHRAAGSVRVVRPSAGGSEAGGAIDGGRRAGASLVEVLKRGEPLGRRGWQSADEDAETPETPSIEAETETAAMDGSTAAPTSVDGTPAPSVSLYDPEAAYLRLRSRQFAILVYDDRFRAWRARQARLSDQQHFTVPATYDYEVERDPTPCLELQADTVTVMGGDAGERLGQELQLKHGTFLVNDRLVVPVLTRRMPLFADRLIDGNEADGAVMSTATAVGYDVSEHGGAFLKLPLMPAVSTLGGRLRTEVATLVRIARNMPTLQRAALAAAAVFTTRDASFTVAFDALLKPEPVRGTDGQPLSMGSGRAGDGDAGVERRSSAAESPYGGPAEPPSTSAGESAGGGTIPRCTRARLSVTKTWPRGRRLSFERTLNERLFNPTLLALPRGHDSSSAAGDTTRAWKLVPRRWTLQLTLLDRTRVARADQHVRIRERACLRYERLVAQCDRAYALLEPQRQLRPIPFEAATRRSLQYTVDMESLLYTGEASPRARLRPYVAAFGVLDAGLERVAFRDDAEPWTLRGALSGGLRGQLGRWRRAVLDYTGFSVSLRQAFGTPSPLLHLQEVLPTTLHAGVLQQLFGPVRVAWERRWILGRPPVTAPMYGRGGGAALKSTLIPIDTRLTVDMQRESFQVRASYHVERRDARVSARVTW